MNDSQRESVMSVKIPVGLAKRVARIAADLGVSSAEVVQTAIRQGLKQAAPASPSRPRVGTKTKNG